MNKIEQNVTENTSTVGQRLRAWRKSIPLTLVGLAKKIQVSQATLSELENNKSLPSAGTLTNLCVYSDLNLRWVLTGEGPMVRDDLHYKTESGMSEELLSLMQEDPNLSELMEGVAKILKTGDPQKKAHLKGFITGATLNN